MGAEHHPYDIVSMGTLVTCLAATVMLTPGPHAIRFVIENARPKDENGNHGYWRVSGVVMGVED